MVGKLVQRNIFFNLAHPIPVHMSTMRRLSANNRDLLYRWIAALEKYNGEWATDRYPEKYTLGRLGVSYQDENLIHSLLGEMKHNICAANDYCDWSFDEIATLIAMWLATGRDHDLFGEIDPFDEEII